MLRDIRELADQQEAYADELRRRWGGLLSYRYLGRTYASMDPRAVEDTVFLARGKVGPFRVETEAMAGRDGTVGARVVLHDEGADDKAITAGSYVFTVSR